MLRIAEIWAGKYLEVYVQYEKNLYLIALNCPEEVRNEYGISDEILAQTLVDSLKEDEYKYKWTQARYYCSGGVCQDLIDKHGLTKEQASYSINTVEKL